MRARGARGSDGGALRLVALLHTAPTMTTPPDPLDASTSRDPGAAAPSPADRRTAVAALDQARPLVARLDPGAPADGIAADLADAWRATETSLRALLGGSALAGQPLVTEARRRGLLEYAHAHALLAFHEAAARAAQADVRPAPGDVVAARAGFQALESALGVGYLANTGTFDAIRPDRDPLGYGGRDGAGRGTARADAPGEGRAPLAPAPRADGPAASYGGGYGGATLGADLPIARTRRVPLGWILGLLALVAVAAIGIWWASNRSSAFDEGVAAYRAGQREVARARFAEALRADPNDAQAHVFLGRLARDEGDVTRAASELSEAIRLDTASALAYREMGQLQLQAERPDLAARFLTRAVERAPEDRTALGWLGCALARQGRPDLAQNFARRAGTGDWSACIATPGVPAGGPANGAYPPGAPGAAGYPPAGAAPGAYPPGTYAPPAGYQPPPR